MILAIGTDIVEVDRIEDAVARHGDRFLNRIFTSRERAYCDARNSRFVHYAGRFAAKEAAMKALGTGWGDGVAWRDVEILSSGAGAPTLEFSGVALERFRTIGGIRALVSISHTGTNAIAHVVIE